MWSPKEEQNFFLISLKSSLEEELMKMLSVESIEIISKISSLSKTEKKTLIPKRNNIEKKKHLLFCITYEQLNSEAQSKTFEYFGSSGNNDIFSPQSVNLSESISGIAPKSCNS